MKLSILAASTALLLCPCMAMAQTNTPSTQLNATPSTTLPQNAQQDLDAKDSRGSMRMQVRDMMQKAGFTDIHVMTGSLLIRAKDRDGNPVVMNVSPDSVTEIAEVGSANDSARANSADESAPSRATMSGSEFLTLPNSDEMASNLIGLNVYNTANKSIGQIKDIAMGPNGRTQAYILSVGGFLGMGEHYVAVNPTNVNVSYNTSDKKWHATMDADADQLKGAPEFKYNGRWNASKS